MADDTPVVKETAKKAVRVDLFSRLDYPVTLEYNSDNIMIPPRGSALDLDPELINGDLPSGVQKIVRDV
jgi:hypothetical protein